MIMAYNFPISNTSGTSSGSYDSFVSVYGNETGLEVSDHDFLDLNEWFEDDIPVYNPLSAGYNPQANYNTSNVQFSNVSLRGGDMINGNNGIVKERTATRDKVAFKTKSEIEVLDDGFKWRKYGKKMVKNNQYPRNYYKCSIEGCPVKKRVERDNEDRRYVLTTYEGIHNHQCPTI
ncbi:hypothetical protein ACS0TY_012559 [Phlomoides rotata]